MPPADPLHHQRLALAGLDVQDPLPPDWPAQATLSLDPDLVSGWIGETVAGELQDLPAKLTLPGGVFGDLVLTQDLTVEPVEVAVVGGVLHVATPVRGDVEVVLQTLLGEAAEELSWTGTVLCAFRVELDGSDVVARPHEPDRWGLELVLGESPDAVDATLGIVLEEALRAGLAVSPPPPRVLAVLPDQTVRALRLRLGADALVVDFAFDVLNPGQVGDVPSPEGGFVAVLPARTALALAQAAVLAEPPTAEVVEPTSLRLSGTAFELGVRHHVATPWRPRRSYSLTGELVLQDGELLVQPAQVEALGGTVSAALSEDHRRQLLADLTRALTVSVPSRSTVRLAGKDREVEALRLEGRDQQLLVWGRAGG